MKKNLFHSQAGFNLVELIVVIAIMGILASIVYGSFAGARAAARDDERENHLKNLQLAIELYKAENGVYPAGGCDMHAGPEPKAWVSPGPFTTGAPYGDGTTGTRVDCEEYILGLVPDYIAELPVERNVADRVGYRYAVNRARTDYKLISHNAVEANDVSPDSEFHRCRLGCTIGWCSTLTDMNDPGLRRTLAVYSAGAACW